MLYFFLTVASMLLAGPEALLGLSIYQGYSRAIWVGSEVDELGYESMWPRPGYQVGASHTVGLARGIGLRLGVANIARGFRSFPGAGRDERFHMGTHYGMNLDYVEFSALGEAGFKIVPGRSIYALAGPQLAMRRTCDSLSLRSCLRHCGLTEQFRLADVGISWGVGTSQKIFGGLTLSVDLIFTRGFRTMMDPSQFGDNEIVNKATLLQAGIGPVFGW